MGNSISENTCLLDDSVVDYHTTFDGLPRCLIIRSGVSDSKCCSLFPNSNIEREQPEIRILTFQNKIRIWDVTYCRMRDFYYHKLIAKRNYSHCFVICCKYDEDITPMLLKTYGKIPTIVINIDRSSAGRDTAKQHDAIYHQLSPSAVEGFILSIMQP